MKKFIAAISIIATLAGGWIARQPLLSGLATGALVMTMASNPALASNCAAFTYTLTNGQTADANQVMANFNTLLTCANNNLAHNGANSDITSLTGITTPITVPEGGTGLGTLTANGVVIGNGTSTPTFITPGTAGNTLVSSGSSWSSSAPVVRSYLAGLTMSTAGSSATMTVAAGVATDSTNAVSMTNASSINKTTSGWAVGSGNGCLDTGSIANSTKYYFFEIERTDLTVVDVLCSLSSSSPTMPANYTYQRYIGMGLTNGSAQWTAFTQTGDLFQWSVPPLDANGLAPGDTNGHLVTLSVPVGPKVTAIFNGVQQNGGANVLTLFSSPDMTDALPLATASPLTNGTAQNIGNTEFPALYQLLTNTSGQIRYRFNSTSLTPTLYIVTLGWIDRRGRDN